MIGLDAWRGKLVRLRALVPEDADAVFEQVRDTESYFLSDAVPYPPPVNALRSAFSQTYDGDEVRLAIVGPEDRLVGWVQAYNANPRHGLAYVGIGITDPAQRRKGYAGDAICVVLRHLFHERRYHKVEAHVFEFNGGSQALFKSLGFVQEGCLRQRHFAAGRYWDVLPFGMTTEEFARQHPDYRIPWVSACGSGE